MKNAAILLKENYPKQGYTLRSLSERIGKSFKTVQRYTKGESRIPLEDAVKLAELVFNTKKAQSEFITQCRRELKEKTYGHDVANERRKAHTEVKNKYNCHLRIRNGVQHGDPKRFLEIVESCKSQEDLDKLDDEIDWNYKKSTGDIWVIISEKAETPEQEKPVLVISSEFGLASLISGKDEGVLIGSDRNLWRSLLSGYYKYCRANKLSMYGLFELALQTIEESSLLYASEYTNEKQIFLELSQLEEMQDAANDSLELVKGKSTKKKLMNRIKFLVAYLDALQNQPEKIEQNRKKLSSFLNDLILLHF